ncbi:hypothetical protein SAMN03159354_02657 [Pseudomonas sp. NFPP19]|nr:hypothetical protein SAMN03159354_02657 [Pseudomonas sp. NFPP19]
MNAAALCSFRPAALPGPSFPTGVPLMPVRHWPLVLLLLLFGHLSGCSGNYTFNDHSYRPLGDPQTVNRGK